jgi:hypothetical protein
LNLVCGGFGTPRNRSAGRYAVAAHDAESSTGVMKGVITQSTLQLPSPNCHWLLILSTLAGACGAPAPPSTGSWVGDAEQADGADQIEVTVDSGGTTAHITVAAWQVDTVTASRITDTRDSLVFAGIVRQQTMRLTGILADGAWNGGVSLGERHTSVHMVRLFPLGDADRRAMVGTYRTGSGRVIGIAPFSELGARPMLIDYETGRLGPLYPVSRDRLIAMTHPWTPARAAGQTYVLLLSPGSTYLTPQPGRLEERRAEYARWADSLARVGKLDVEGHLEPPGNVVDGLFIIRAANDSDAARIAATCPHIKYRGHIEVRRFIE